MAALKERYVEARKLKRGDTVLTLDGFLKVLEVRREALFVTVYTRGTTPGQERTAHDFAPTSKVRVK